MNLPYDNITDNILLSSDSISLNSINKILGHLAANDIALANPYGSSPEIWECKWYNDDSVSGYPAGYAVWYNTEDIKSFIKFNADRIYSYAKNNNYLKSIIQPLNAGSYSLYCEILSGYHVPNTTMTLPPLFDIGVLSDAVQIRVSTVDDNKQPPSDNKCWKDFIIRDEYASVAAVLSSMTKQLFAEHMQKYHFGDNQLKDSIDDYLKKDLSNVKNVQKFQSHSVRHNMSGFDYVQKFVRKPFELKCINSVLSAVTDNTYWKLKNYSQYADKNGRITSDAKATFAFLMQNCANYISDDIETAIVQLDDKAIVNITYIARSSTLVPYTATDYAEISSRAHMYNCTYDLAPLTAKNYDDIASKSDMYSEVRDPISSYYPEVKYTYYKWYRLWNSGYLEHGGIVPIVSAGYADVKFDWEYADENRICYAPIYDYPTTINSFYGNHTDLTEDNSSKYDQNGNLSPSNRYSVCLTPLAVSLSSVLSGEDLSYAKEPDNYGDYIANEVNTMKNDGFRIYANTANVPYYSYYVSGYKIN